MLKYYHVKDAKLSLASHLLKHLIITKYCDVPWSRSTISREANGKPCFIPDANLPDQRHIEFNVSHQAGIVTLIASIGFKGKVDIGTDVVCVSERRVQDYKSIEKEGFFAWVDMHGEVFAPEELNQMKLSSILVDLGAPNSKIQDFGNDATSRCQWRNQKLGLTVLDGEEQRSRTLMVESNIIIDAKLRRFYAFWCLREAYVKMTGEALLAPWLKDLEFRDVQVPSAKEEVVDSGFLLEGEILTDFAIYFKKRAVKDVKVDLRALGRDFMVAGVARPECDEDEQDIVLGRWIELDLEADILDFAESNL